MKILVKVTDVATGEVAAVTGRDNAGRAVRLEIPGPQAAGLQVGMFLVLEWVAFEAFEVAPDTQKARSADTAFLTRIIGQ